jgi:hypothetical protein
MCLSTLYCLLVSLVQGTLPSGSLRHSPLLEAERRTLVRTRCAPGVSVVPRATTTSTASSAPLEVG